MEQIKVEWDTEGEAVDLPSVVEIPTDLEDDEVAEWLSEHYGWTVLSWYGLSS